MYYSGFLEEAYALFCKGRDLATAYGVKRDLVYAELNCAIVTFEGGMSGWVGDHWNVTSIFMDGAEAPGREVLVAVDVLRIAAAEGRERAVAILRKSRVLAGDFRSFRDPSLLLRAARQFCTNATG